MNYINEDFILSLLLLLNQDVKIPDGTTVLMMEFVLVRNLNHLQTRYVEEILFSFVESSRDCCTLICCFGQFYCSLLRITTSIYLYPDDHVSGRFYCRIVFCGYTVVLG
jgi:hypothetical protein